MTTTKRKRPADLDRHERDKRTQPMSDHQMALIMSVGEMEAGLVIKVLLDVAGTKRIDELSAGQCRKASTMLGLTDEYEKRLGLSPSGPRGPGPGLK